MWVAVLGGCSNLLGCWVKPSWRENRRKVQAVPAGINALVDKVEEFTKSWVVTTKHEDEVPYEHGTRLNPKCPQLRQVQGVVYLDAYYFRVS